MAAYGPKSQAVLATLHWELARVFKTVLLHADHALTAGHRGEAEQNAAFAAGYSKLRWPQSPHNRVPSDAVDVMPAGTDWRTDADLLAAAQANDWPRMLAVLENIKRWYHFAGFVRGVAAEAGIGLRWGGDWDGDFKFDDQTFVDLPHFERMP